MCLAQTEFCEEKRNIKNLPIECALPNKEVEKIWVPVANEKLAAKFHLEEQPILFPHRIISYLFDVCGLDIPVSNLHYYWDTAKSNGVAFADETCRNKIPLGLYGDGAQLWTKVRKEKIWCFFLSIPLFRPRSVRYSRFLLWACDASKLYRNRTTNTVLRWLVWSLNCLFVGMNPTVRPGGRELSDKEKTRAGTPITQQKLEFQVVELRGDWEYHKFICNLSHLGNRSMCALSAHAKSRDDDPGLLYWNHRIDSTWSQSEFTTAQYISKCFPTIISAPSDSTWQCFVSVYCIFSFI